MTQDFTFAPAVRRQKRLRIALEGVAGSGKTATALRLARALFPDGKIALIDTEGGSAAAYACNEGEEENLDLLRFNFGHLVLRSYAPDTYVNAIESAERGAFDVVIIDSLSHAWAGKDGALEQVDRRRASMRNDFQPWAEVTPMQNRLVDAILQSPIHVIATLRVNTDWQLEKNDAGKLVPVKIGTKPVQRDSMDYEFDVVGTLDMDHVLTITKTRCQALDGARMGYPGHNLAEPLTAWISDGAPAQKSPRELMAAFSEALRVRGMDYSLERNPQERALLTGHLQALLGERVTQESTVAWLHAHDDDVALLVQAVASRMGIPDADTVVVSAPGPHIEADTPEASQAAQDEAEPPDALEVEQPPADVPQGEPVSIGL